MKKFLLLASVACFAATSVSAFEFNPYVSAKAKYALSRNKVKVTGVYKGEGKINDDVFGGSVAVGTIYNLMDGDFRFEIEYTKNADAEKHGGKVKTQGVLFNVYYDFNLRTELPITPYVGAGLGWGHSEFEGVRRSKDDDDGTSVQVGCGINYRVTDHAVVDLGYRYISYGDFDEEYRIPGRLYEKYEYEPRAHEIMLGVRYEF